MPRFEPSEWDDPPEQLADLGIRREAMPSAGDGSAEVPARALTERSRLEDISPDVPMDDVTLTCWDGTRFVTWEKWRRPTPIERIEVEPGQNLCSKNRSAPTIRERDSHIWLEREDSGSTEARWLPQVCGCCRGRLFWRKRSGDFVCALCHPPASRNSVVEWVKSKSACDSPAGEHLLVDWIRSEWASEREEPQDWRTREHSSEWLLNHPYGQIEIEGREPLTGRWLAQWFDHAGGTRYSIGRTPAGAFFVIRLDNLNRSVALEWFEDAQAVQQSELPAQLKRATQTNNPPPPPPGWKAGSSVGKRARNFNPNFIEIEGHEPIEGAWLTHHLDRTAGEDYSLGQTPDKRFFVVVRKLSGGSLQLEWFESAEAVHQSGLPAEFKRAVNRYSGWAPKKAGETPAPKRTGEPIAGSGVRVPISERDPLLPAPPTDACAVCGERQYWRSLTGQFRCARCDPPPRPDHLSVEEWWYEAS